MMRLTLRSIDMQTDVMLMLVACSCSAR